MIEHMQKQFHMAMIATTIIFIGSSLYILYLFSDGTLINSPLMVTQQPKTTEGIYRPGELVQATISFCKRRNLTAVLQWSLVDTYLKTYPSRETSIVARCYNNLTIAIERIPIDSLPGTYHFVGLAKYRINGFSEVDYPLHTNDFKIVD